MKLDFLKNIFNKKNQSALGIDIGTSSVKVVQVSRKGDKIVLDTYGELSYGPYGNTSVGEAINLPTEKISEALTALLSEQEVHITTKNAGLAVPFESSLMTTFTLPTAASKNLEAAVPIEARKYIPVPISEVTLDWSVVTPENKPHGKTAANKNGGADTGIEILLVAIHNDILAEYQKIAEATKLEMRFFEIEIFSTLRSLIGNENKPILVIDMGAMSTKIYIIEQGVVRNSHTINVGSQDVTKAIAQELQVSFSEAEVIKRESGLEKTDDGTHIQEIAKEVLDRMFSQINRVLFNFVQKHGKAVSEGFLVGGGAALKGIDAYATEILKTPMKMGNPFSKLETPAFVDDVLSKTGPEFVVAVGVAMRALEESE